MYPFAQDCAAYRETGSFSVWGIFADGGAHFREKQKQVLRFAKDDKQKCKGKNRSRSSASRRMTNKRARAKPDSLREWQPN